MDDWNLLQQYVQDGSRQALDELTRRHMDMVYWTARRQLNDPHLAEDVTQAVFLILMRRCPHIPRRVVLSGWLFNTARYAAANARRARQRRELHEREAAMEKHSTTDPQPDELTEKLTPLLNDAIASLPRVDREAVVMKFLERKTHREVAEAQQIKEPAARKRVERALAKLRLRLQASGLAMSGEALGAALLKVSIQPGPPHLAATIAATLTSPASAEAANQIANFTMRMMMKAMMIKTVASICASLFILTGAGGVLLHYAFAQQVAANPLPPAQPPIAAVAETPATQPAAFAPADTQKATILAAAHATLAGDEAAVIACMTDLTPKQEAALRQGVQLIGAAQALNTAVESRFGKPVADRIDQSMNLTFGFGSDLLKKALEQAKFTSNGSVDISELNPNGLNFIPMVKSGNVWKIDAALMDNHKLGVVPLLAQITPAIRQITDGVTDGKYRTIQDLRLDLMQLQRQLTALTGGH